MAMPSNDLIKDMTFLELHALANLVAERMHELRETGLEKLYDDLEEKASSLGVSIAELINVAKKKKRRRRARQDDDTTDEPE